MKHKPSGSTSGRRTHARYFFKRKNGFKKLKLIPKPSKKFGRTLPCHEIRTESFETNSIRGRAVGSLWQVGIHLEGPSTMVLEYTQSTP